MIKKQYNEWPEITGSCYFNKFLSTTKSNAQAAVELRKYNAEFGKCKRNSGLNVKWHNPKLYMLFVLRWS
jgi:hypothetical protein